MEALLGLGVFLNVILTIFVALLPLISTWVIFKKAGEPGWAAIIPIFNIITMLKVAGKPIWWFFMFLIPFVNVIFLFLTLDGLAKSFGKSTAFTLGLFLLPGIFYLILAFGSSTHTKLS